MDLVTEKILKSFSGEKKIYAVYNVVSKLTPEQAKWLKEVGHRVEDVNTVIARGSRVLFGTSSPKQDSLDF